MVNAVRYILNWLFQHCTDIAGGTLVDCGNDTLDVLNHRSHETLLRCLLMNSPPGSTESHLFLGFSKE